MSQTMRWPHWAATAIAASCVAYQTAVIWEALDAVSPITRIGVPLATLSVAILPVLAESAWRSGERSKGLLMLLPLLILLGYVLPSGTARLGEAQQQRRIAAEQAQINQARLRTELAEAQKLAREADVEAARECKSGLGTKCKGAQATLAQRQAAAKDLAARVEQIRPVASTWLPDWHPATLPLGLELAAWAALFFGLGPMTHRPVQAAITERDTAVDPITDAEIEELRRLLRSIGRPVTNSELARLAKISNGECSKRVADAVAAGVVRKQRAGRAVAITLH